MRFLNYLKKAFTIFFSAALAVIIGANIYIMVCGIRGKPAFIGNICILRISTGSMEPSLHVGDFIIVKKNLTDNLQTGDIISFYSEDKEIYGKINTHRIVKKASDGFVTRGDANPTEDSVIVHEERVIGKYTGKIRFLRWLGSFASTRKLLMFAVILPTLALSVYEVVTITKIKNECDEEKKKILREAIDREKELLYKNNYQFNEVNELESGKNNEKENADSNSI